MAQSTSSKSAADDAARAANDAARAAAGAARAAEGAANAAADTDPIVYEVQKPVVYEVATQRPIVYEVRKGRKGRKGRRKKKYSRGLKAPQKVEQGLSRSAERLAEAVADGLTRYRRRENRSARKKRDGAIKDALRNIGRGAEKALRTGSRAPTDFTKRLSVKRLTRFCIPPLPGFVR
ncbi:MAG: hypothetical protein JF614_11860 [Acidobacteria bacterium]|nr:hypothetical protein [Acidobacteriota bacterium]